MELEVSIKMSTNEFLQLKKSKNIKPLFVKSFINCIYSEINKEEIETLDKLIKKSKNIKIRIKNLKSKNLIKINEINIEINNFLKEEFLKLNNISYQGIILYTLVNPDYPLIYMIEDCEALAYQADNITNIWILPITSSFIPVNEPILGIITFA